MGISQERWYESAARTTDKNLRAGVWELWPHYTLSRALKEPDGSRFLRAPLDHNPERFRPHIDYPALFLEFARLPDEEGLEKELDTDKNAEIALDWVRRYGVLGLTNVEEPGRVGVNIRGGNKDTVAAFAHESWIAHDTLRLYEAATHPDGPDVETISAFIHPRHRGFYIHTPEVAKEWALLAVANRISEYTARYCYESPYVMPGGKRVIGKGFRNLLGAMWQQMLWLWADGEPKRCKNWECRRVIDYEHPEQPTGSLKRDDRSGGYRTRKDKKFCSMKCANRYHYLTVRKPKRQRESEEHKARRQKARH